jgi:Family of unknown function (DUF6502)
MNKSAREKEAVLSVFASLVRPLTRVAFEYGITASEISGAVRRTYIQALEARLVDQKRPPTDTRLAAVSGLTKSDVAALREATRAGAPHSLRATISLDQVTNLLTVWHTHSGFSGAYGLALELDLVTSPGSPRKSFVDLVAAACPGADVEALLDELVASESVEVVHGTVRCLSRAYLPHETDVKRIEWMGRILTNVASSFVHNLLRANSEPVYFERAVVCDNSISEEGRDKFLALAGERGQEMLTELDTFLTRLVPPDQSDSGRRFGVGIYFFEDQPDSRTADAPSVRVFEDKSARATGPIEIDVLAGLVSKK